MGPVQQTHCMFSERELVGKLVIKFPFAKRYQEIMFIYNEFPLAGGCNDLSRFEKKYER